MIGFVPFGEEADFFFKRWEGFTRKMMVSEGRDLL